LLSGFRILSYMAVEATGRAVRAADFVMALPLMERDF
jgi:hypothetical protein